MKPARRALVRGALVAPFALTVGPASGRAQASSVVCLRRDSIRATTERPNILKLDADDWFRVRVDFVELSMMGSHPPKRIPGKYFLGMDRRTYWLYTEAGIGGATAVPSEYNRNNCTASKTLESRFALVYVDQTGRYTGYAFEKNGGTPVTGSCWASVAALR